MSRTLRLGVFVFCALLILAAGIFMIGSHRFLFSSTYRLQAEFPTASGLGEGAEVRVGGIHEGTVASIRLPADSNQKVTVFMDMQKSTRQVIKRDSVASVQTEGLIGNKFVSISFGSKDSPMVNDGDTIEGAPPLDISDLLRKANDILDNAGTATKNMTEITQNLVSVTGKVNEGKGTLGALINDRQMYEQTKAGIASFQDNMEALKGNFFLRGFFSRRGYKNTADLTTHEIASLPQSPSPLKVFSYDTKQIFGKPDSAKLKNDKTLNDAGQFLEQNKFALAVVVDYSPSTGDNDKDLMLSRARAMLVREYLVKKFKFDATRVKTKGLGKQAAAEAGKAAKLEVVVYPEGVTLPRTKSTSGK